MRTIALVVLTLCLSATGSRADLEHLWSHSYGDGNDQYISGCFADPFGNIVIYGAFYGTINITAPFTSVGARDIFLAKFNPSGTPMWSVKIGHPFPDTGWAATSDNVGNTILVGSIAPTDEERSAFIARYSPTGVQQWMHVYASTDSSSFVERVGVDPNKQIYVAGSFNGTLNLGGSNLVALAENDMFLAKFTPGGSHIWSKRITGGGNFDELLFDVDPAGQPVVATSFLGSVSFGGGLLTAVSGYDMCIAKFTTAGAHMWSKRFGLTGFHYVADIAVDAKGRVALGGESWGNIDFGGGVLNSPAGPDVSLAMLEGDGDHMWSDIYGAGDQEYANDVAFASNSDLLLTVNGRGTDPFDLGGGPLSGQGLTGDMFVARYFANTGNHRWSERFYWPDGETYGYIGETNGHVFMAGTMTGDEDFGGGTLTNNGGEDIWVVRFGEHLTGAGPSLARAELLQNSPNPFNPTTRIEYSLASPADAVIEIYDASGAVVTRLDEGRQPTGMHSTIWNGRDASGRAVASGVYFYRLAGMPEVGARKMVLLK